MINDVNPVQPLNKPKRVIVEGVVIDVNLEQPEKHQLPKDLTVEGIVNDVNLVQSLKQ
jgi:hypothetical protein